MEWFDTATGTESDVDEDFYSIQDDRPSENCSSSVSLTTIKNEEKTEFSRILEAIKRIEKKKAKLQGSEKALVGSHEAGHAVVGTAVSKLLSGQPRVEIAVKPHSSPGRGPHSSLRLLGRLGLSRERVRQIGLATQKKLKHAARHT